MPDSSGPQDIPPSKPTIGKIDCPTPALGSRRGTLIRDDEGRPKEVNCLGCEGFFPAEDVAWRSW